MTQKPTREIMDKIWDEAVTNILAEPDWDIKGPEDFQKLYAMISHHVPEAWRAIITQIANTFEGELVCRICKRLDEQGTEYD